MNVQAKSHLEAWNLISKKPKFYNVVYIADPERPFYNQQTKEIIRKANKSLICLFHDIEDYVPGKQAPSYEMVKKIIDFGEKKNDIICCCPSGVSRSVAVAYVLSSIKFYNDAFLKILDVEKHMPNFLIVQYGSEILKKPDLLLHLMRFREQALSIKL